MNTGPQPWTPSPVDTAQVRAPVGARMAVGAAAALIGVIAWMLSGLAWSILLRRAGPPVLPRGFLGIDSSMRRAPIPQPWIGLLVLAAVIALVVASAASRGRAGSRAAAFFSGWFAAGLGAASASVISIVGLYPASTFGTDHGAVVVASAVSGGAYWGLGAGWIVGIAAAVGTGLVPAGRPVPAVGAAVAPETYSLAPPQQGAVAPDPVPAPEAEPPR